MSASLPPLIVTPDELLRIARDVNPPLAVLLEQLIAGKLHVRVPAELLKLSTA